MRIAWGLAAVLLTSCVQLFSLDKGENVDSDNDNVVDHAAGGGDNCDGVFNPDQSDFDADLIGDLCDTCDSGGEVDADADGIPDGCDGCVSNGEDKDADGIPDNCDPCVLVGADATDDADEDGIPDQCDGCIGNGVDRDSDGIPDNCDSCVSASSADGDVDGIPDACDACPTGGGVDGDNDGIEDACDVCPMGGGLDLDQDGLEDASPTATGEAPGCDPCFGPNLDEDKDGYHDACDNCPGEPNPDQADADGFASFPDGVGTFCDVDDQSGTRLYFDPFTAFVPDWLVGAGTWTTGPSELRLVATDVPAIRQRYSVNGSFRIVTMVSSFDTSMLGATVRVYATGASGTYECIIDAGAVSLVSSGITLASTRTAPAGYPAQIMLAYDELRSELYCAAGKIDVSGTVSAPVSNWTTGLGGTSTTATFGFFQVTSSY